MTKTEHKQKKLLVVIACTLIAYPLGASIEFNMVLLDEVVTPETTEW